MVGNVDCAGELQVSLSQQPLLCNYVRNYALTESVIPAILGLH